MLIKVKILVVKIKGLKFAFELIFLLTKFMLMGKKTDQKNDTLFLIIKKFWLDQIIAGTKKIEYRDFTDYYISRFCIIDKEKNEITDTKVFKYVLFQAGYSKKAFRAKFELEGIFITEYINEIPEGLAKGDMMFELDIGPQVEL